MRGARRAVALGGRAVDRREEPGPHAGRRDVVARERAPHLGLERARHPDAVLVLQAAVVRVERREVELREQVVLVGREHETTAERRREPRLPRVHGADDGARFRDRVRPHLRLAAVRAHAERHDAERRQLRKAVEHAEQRVVEHRAVVDAGAHDDLAVHLDPRAQQQLEPAQAGRAPPVAQQPCSHVGVGRVDAHVERAEPLADDPLEVGFGEPGQRREVSVEKRQAEVVVLEVEAAAHPLRELMDEAERAVVVARLHPVEHRVRELEPERRTLLLVHHQLLLEPAPPDFEVDLGRVGLQLVGDHVAELLAVDREDLVARRDAGLVRR